MRTIAALAVSATLFSFPCPALAQDTATVSPMAYAAAARDSGRFSPAADTLRALLAREPQNGDAARMLAQTLYWLRDSAGARALYEKAMTDHPEDVTLRLDYGRMLVETRQDARATEVLTPLLSDSMVRARAATLIGTMQYWQGDLTSAEKNFRVALAADRGTADAARQLQEIRTVAAPWLSLHADGLHDDQPLNRIGGDVEAGWFVTPLSGFSVSARDEHRTSDSLSTDAVSAEIGYFHSMPRSRMQLEASGGAVRQTGASSQSTWIAHAQWRVGLPNQFSLAAGFARAPYLATASSISAPFVTQAGSVTLSRESGIGLLASTSLRYERFPDTNNLTSAFGWILAPVVHSNGTTLRAGYSLAWQDSRDNRFVLDRPGQPLDLNGHYAPYYTPENVLSHSALALLSFHSQSGVIVTAGGGYGIHATEDAPQYVTASTGGVAPLFQFAKRDFHPWNAEVKMDAPVTPATSLIARFGHSKTAFYSATSASLAITWKKLPAPLH